MTREEMIDYSRLRIESAYNTFKLLKFLSKTDFEIQQLTDYTMLYSQVVIFSRNVTVFAMLIKHDDNKITFVEIRIYCYPS